MPLPAARIILRWCATSSIRARAPGSFAKGLTNARGAGRRNTGSQGAQMKKGLTVRCRKHKEREGTCKSR